MTPSTLERAVRIALQARVLGKTLALDLPVSHHRALLPVRSDDEKRLLAEAERSLGGCAARFDLIAGTEIRGEESRDEHRRALLQDALGGAVSRWADLGDAATMDGFD